MSERPTQNELDEANASHAQEVEEQEVLKLAKDCSRWFGEANGRKLAHFEESGLFNFASKLRAKDTATIARLKEELGDGTTGNKYRAELYDEVWNKARRLGFANVTDALEEVTKLRTRLSGQTCFVPPEFQAELSASQEHVKLMRSALVEISTFPRYRMPADIAKEALAATVPAESDIDQATRYR